jgi:hypothetical protein
MTELIYSLKNIYKNKDIDAELLNKIVEINNLISTSTQFQETKKKLSNVLYYTKWKLDKIDVNNPINIAYQSMNKLCENNFENIYNELVSLVFTNNLLEKLTSKLVIKIINERKFIEIYIKMIYKLIINSNWITLEKVTFRQILLENIKKNYYENNCIGLFYLIGYLFKYKIFSYTLIISILEEYISKINLNHNDNDIEKLLVLWSLINNNIKEYNIDGYNKYNIIITELYPKMSKRLQYMSIDSYNIINNNNIDNNNNNNNNNNDVYYDYITYIDEFDTIQLFLEEIISKPNFDLEIFLKCVIKYTIDESKEFNKIKNILKEGINNNFWTNNILLKIIEYIEINELNEIIIDAPYYNKHLEEYKKIDKIKI